MSKVAYLGIDQGTRSSKAVLLDRQNKQIFFEQRSISLDDRGGGVVNQDANEILASVREVLAAALRYAQGQKITIATLGFAVQRSGVTAWHAESGKAQYPLISWADTSYRNIVDQLGARATVVQQKTSLPVLAHYAAPKLAALQNKYTDNNILVGTLDSFLFWNLLDEKRFFTEDTMAARSMLYSLAGCGWDLELLSLFGVNRVRLPTISPSIGTLGSVGGIPLSAALGDQQAALLAITQQGFDCLLNLGSIVSILVPTSESLVRSPGFISSVAYSREIGQGREYHYYLEGTVNAAASVVDYLVSEKKFLSGPDVIDQLCQEYR